MDTVVYNRLRKIATADNMLYPGDGQHITADMLYSGPLQYITGRHKPRELEPSTRFNFSRFSDPDYVLAGALGVPRNLFVHSAAQRITPKQAYTMAYTNREAAERDWAISQAARKRAIQQIFGNDFIASLPEDTVYPSVLQGSKLSRNKLKRLKSRILENFFARPTYVDYLTPVRTGWGDDSPYYMPFWSETPTHIADFADVDNPMKYSGEVRIVPGPRFIRRPDLQLTPKVIGLHEIGGHAATLPVAGSLWEAPVYSSISPMLKNIRGGYGLLPAELLGGLHHLKAAYNSKYYPERLAEDNMDRATEQLRDKKLLDSKTGLLTDEIFKSNGYSADASTVNSAIEVKQLPEHEDEHGVQDAKKQIDKDYAEYMPLAKNYVGDNTLRNSVQG